jgi:hypothetical protein
MTTRENINSTACVIKTSKNVTAQMKLPMWNRELHGLTMPTNKANLYERSLSNHNLVRELSRFQLNAMLNRPGAVLYSGTSVRPKATFIEHLDALADQLQVKKVRNNLYTCDNEMGKRLLGCNAIIDKASVSLDQLYMDNTVLMGNSCVARATLKSCIIDGYSSVFGGEHEGLVATGQVILHDVNTSSTRLSGNVILSSETGKETVTNYRLVADGTVNSSLFWGVEASEVADDMWRYAVQSASENPFSTLDTFCLNNALHATSDDTPCKCGCVTPLALAGHPVAISYLLNRAGLTEYIPAEYKGMTEAQMLAELEGIYVYANPHCGNTLIIREKGKRTPTSIRNLEDWKNLIRTEYGLEDVRALYKYH